MKSRDPQKYWKYLNNCSNLSSSNVNMPTHEAFVEYFEKLGSVPEEDIIHSSDPIDPDVDVIDDGSLNTDIKDEEVLKAIRKLKNNKACGFDLILNEFLKSSSSKLCNILTMLFNLVLSSGKIPDDWSVGIICPIYKGKGDKLNVDSYRGITILSCLGKLFTSIINDRIQAFVDDNNLLGNEQAGFRQGNSTTDHVFALHCLIDIYLQQRKRLFCTFVDYKKAFDSVQRSLLWDKLLNSGIFGKVLNKRYVTKS